MISCSNSSQDREAAMIAQAQKDAAAETQYQQDSLAFIKTFTMDTVQIKDILLKIDAYEDDDGNQKADTTKIYYFRGKKNMFCMINLTKYNMFTVPDTISCQWTKTIETQN
jgi:hypothetical protein